MRSPSPAARRQPFLAEWPCGRFFGIVQSSGPHAAHLATSLEPRLAAKCLQSRLLRTLGSEARGLSVSVREADASERMCPLPCGDAHGECARGGTRMAPRLLSYGGTRAPEGALQLLPRPRGSLGGLQAQPHGVDGASVGDTWVSVRAVGLNFRDVLNVLGMYPGDPGAPGGDFSGVVVSSLSGALGGTCVFGLSPGCLGTHSLTAACLAPSKPCALTFEQAAAVPTIFVTVSLALSRTGRLAGGGSVLVHAASGGVGLAASEVLRSAGCCRVATAGSERKRALLRALDAGVCASSRDVRGQHLEHHPRAGPLSGERGGRVVLPGQRLCRA